MKSCYQVYIVIISLSITLISCKKEQLNLEKVESQTALNSSIFSRENASKVSSQQIEDWLNSQKGDPDLAVKRNYFIQKIIESLQYDMQLIQDYSSNQNLISIPLTKSISMHDGNGTFLTYLIIVEDKESKILSGEVVVVESQASNFKQENMVDLFLNNDCGFKGKIKLLDFRDFEYFSKEFNGQLTKTVRSFGDKSTLDDCIHWIHVYGIYDLVTGEIIEYEIEDLGCSSCAPNSLCDELDPIGGGTGIPAVTKNIDKDVSANVLSVTIGSNTSKVFCIYNLTGIQNLDHQSLSTFCGITYKSNSMDLTMGAPPATVILIESISHNETFGLYYAKGNVNCTFKYEFTNQPNFSRLGTHTFDTSILN